MTQSLRKSARRPRFLSTRRLGLLFAALAALTGFALGATQKDVEVRVEVIPAACELPHRCLDFGALTTEVPQPMPLPAPAPRTEPIPDPVAEPTSKDEPEPKEPHARPAPTIFVPCRWNVDGCEGNDGGNGFPAFSEDGREFVLWSGGGLGSPDDGRGYPSFVVSRISTETGKLIKSYTLLTSDQLEQLAKSGLDHNALREAAARLLAKRSPRVQRIIDKIGFVPLEPVLDGQGGNDVKAARGFFQIRDQATGWTHYQEVFDAKKEFGPAQGPDPGEDFCTSVPTVATVESGWIDRDSGRLLVQVGYYFASCLCPGGELVNYVRRLKPLPQPLAE